MNTKQFDVEPSVSCEPPNRCVVRLRTTAWSDSRGLHTKRSLIYLRRQCSGFVLLEEEASTVGADATIASITNIHDVPDGVYEVVIHNVHIDRESGATDHCDYKLVPRSCTDVGEYLDKMRGKEE